MILFQSCSTSVGRIEYGNKTIMYHIHVSFSNKTTLTYLYLFEYLETKHEYYATLAIVEKSLFRFGRPKVSFPPHGETIAIYEKEYHSENLSDLVKILIVTFFETEIQGEVQ